ncbi:MAG: ABC transporter permease [Deltaproteobacteria bacterium]|nr:ABC transporter permease [Deltaproteobacteria bacterium]
MMLPLVDTLRSAFRSLRAHKLRSALTLLGIVIGIVSVVAMTATVEGLRRKIEEDLAGLGTGVFQVQKYPAISFGPRERGKYEKRKNLTLADVALIEARCTECERVAGEAWTFGKPIRAGDRVTSGRVALAGGTSGFFDNNGYGFASGRGFSEAEGVHGADVVVLGSDVVDLLFPDESPLGKIVQVQARPLRVIGTLERRGSGLGGESWDSLAVIPIATFLPLFGSRQSLNITVQARDPQHMGRAQDQVVTILRKARGVPPDKENDFDMFSNQSMQDTFSELSSTIAAASIGTCAIALLIGGIGVMNIMLVSVTERTSEIGLRRALGARRRRILGQFLIEAFTLTSLGGALGVLLGAAIAALVKVLVGIPTVVPGWAVVLSMASAGTVGLVFGLYPAVRASRLDPVEAMRHE